MSSDTGRDLVFISYSHANPAWRDRLLVLLKPFVRQGRLQVWADPYIQAGALWRREIDSALARARVGVVLLTPDYLASDFIADVEMPQLLHAAMDEVLKLLIVPVEAHATGSTGLSEGDRFQWAWNPEEPLGELPQDFRNRALVTVTEAIVNAAGARAEYTGGSAVPERTERSPSAQGSLVGELHGVPSLPPHYLSRNNADEQLKQALLGTSAVVGVSASLATVGLHGQGGLGKTVLAQATAFDEEVRQFFADGIFWITVGQQPHLPSLLASLVEFSGERVPVYDVGYGTRLLKERLRGKACLIVLDDVWQLAHARAFDVLEGASRLMVTTRDHSILTALGARDIRLDALPADLAFELLARWAGISVTQLPAEASAIAKEVEYLPLALSLAGALIHDGGSWADLLAALRQGDLVYLDHPYGSVFKSLHASVNALDSADSARYLELAVFPEDVDVPVSVVEQLWHATSGEHPRRLRALLTRLASRSLVRLGQPADDEHAVRSSGGEIGPQTAPTVSLHDLQHDFVRLLVNDLSALHGRLVDAWHDDLPPQPRPGGTEADRWATMAPVPAYAWQFLAHHLLQAGRNAELEGLLTSPDWLFARVKNFSLPALLADYREAKPDAGLRSVHDALVLSSHALTRDATTLSGQLAGRLLDSADPRIQSLIARSPTPLRHRPTLRPTVACLTVPGGPLLQTFAAHRSGVTALTVLPDGQRALSGSRNGTVKLWDLTAGTVLQKLWDSTAGPSRNAPIYSHIVTAVTVLPDGQRALSASQEGLKLWDLTAGTIIRTFRPQAGIGAVAMLSNERALFGISGEETLCLFDLAANSVVQRFEGHKGTVAAVAVLPDGQRALTGSRDNTLKLWDLTTGSVLETFVGHDGDVTTVAVLPDGQRALSGSRDKTLRLWDLSTNVLLQTLEGHNGTVRAVTALPDGQRAFSASEDGTLKLWDLSAGTEVQTFRGHSRSVTALTLLPDGQRALSGSEDGTLKLWDLNPRDVLQRSDGHDGAVLSVAVLPDARRALSGGADGVLKLWNLSTGGVLRTFEGHNSRVTAVKTLPDGERALSASEDGTLKLWDLREGRVLRTFRGHGGQEVTVLPDGRCALSTRGSDQMLTLWDLTTGNVLQTLEAFVDPRPGVVTAVALLSGGRRALSAHADGKLRLWDVAAGRRLEKFHGQSSVTVVTVLPDGQLALSANSDGSLQVWNLTTGTVLRTWKGHDAPVTAVTALPDGQRALSCSEDWTLKMWDVASGTVLCAFHDEAPVKCLAVSDDLCVVAGNTLGRVCILKIE